MSVNHISPVQEAIIKAACAYFEITEDILLSGTTHNICYMRWCCFYLIKKNTFLSVKFIGNRFKKQRPAGSNGIDTIESRKPIYMQTVCDLRTIAEKAGILDF
ncbi:MAG: helix-turn-helix domain-containing protein [Bacteroidia bacterium]